jgi:heat-inducible transcriptional repressor
MDVDERRGEVLRAIVEEHIETAQPVSSQAVARSRGLGVSSATVRNDMTALERGGYLSQPHTSAGRVPTDRGYRYFVDRFADPTAAVGLGANQRRAVSEFFRGTHTALEDLLHETSGLLARITRHAAVVVGPPTESARVRRVDLVPLQPGQILAIAVLSNGAVERELLAVDASLSAEQVADAERALTLAMVDGTLHQPPAPGTAGDPATDALAVAAHAALHRRAEVSDPLYVGGVSRIAAEQDAYATAQTAATLLELLEQQVVVVSLVRDLLDAGVTVSIGSEHHVDELRDCSLVLAPYSVEGEVSGTVGVLGPTRMDYRQALAAVATVSEQLGNLLSR